MGQGNKSYTTEFRAEAVELASKQGITKAAKDLGIAISTLGGWVDKKNKLSKKQEELSYEDLLKENKRLRKEAEYARKINDILKKSIGIISVDTIDFIK